MAATNHGGVMEFGENPEQSRCGNRFAHPIQSNRLETVGAGGGRMPEVRILVPPRLVARPPVLPVKRDQ
jgi:hypothetical protein